MPHNGASVTGGDRSCQRPGCGRSLAGRRAGTKYCDSTCRVQAHKSRVEARERSRAGRSTGAAAKPRRNVPRPPSVTVRLTPVEAHAIDGALRLMMTFLMPARELQDAQIKLAAGITRYQRRIQP